MATPNSDEYAELDGLPLQTAAWTHHNLWELWSGPAVRGGDVVIPGTAGARAERRVVDAWKTTLELSILGDYTPDGAVVAPAGVRAQLWANVAALRAVTDPPATGNGAKMLRLHAPGAVVVSSWVQVERFQLGGEIGPMGAKATIDLVILNGALVAGTPADV